MIKKFIEGHDFSTLPIGPQAELIEALENLNLTIPWEFRDGGLPGYPRIKFDVNKNFTWKYGTFQNVESIKNLLEHSYKHRGFKWGSIKNIWLRPDSYRRSYASTKFKNKVFSIDNMIRQKRWGGEVWLDDDTEINNILDTCIKDIVQTFDNYIEYVGMINKDHVMDEGKDIIQIDLDADGDGTEYRAFMNDILKEMWKFEDTTPKIILRNMSDRTDRSILTVLHPFKDVMMNTYIGERKNPIFTFPIGHVIGCYEFSLDSLIYASLKLSTNYNSNRRYVRTKYWFKPHLKGIYHPYIQYPTVRGLSSSSWRHNDPVDWPIDWRGYSNTCAGNIDIVSGYNPSINVVKWIENVHTWISTFRLGITHPLNNISMGYYGHPERLDPNVDGEYLDRVGMSYADCHDRQRNWIGNAAERNKICNKFCTEEVMLNCHGHKDDLRILNEEAMQKIFKEKSWSQREIYTGSPLGSLDLPEDMEDDNYFEIQDGSSLENAMLSWVRSNQQNS